MPLNKVIRPAIKLAEEGVTVNDALADSKCRVLVAGSLYLAGEVLSGMADRRDVLDLA